MPLIVTAQIVDDATSYRADRKPIDRASTLRVLDSRPYDAHVENLSATGCLLSSAVALTPGTRIRLGLSGGGVVEGAINRQVGDRYGCEFIHPLTDQQMHAAFGAGALVEGRFGPIVHNIADHDTARWPRPVRGTVMIGMAVLTWLTIIVSIQMLRS